MIPLVAWIGGDGERVQRWTPRRFPGADVPEQAMDDSLLRAQETNKHLKRRRIVRGVLGWRVARGTHQEAQARRRQDAPGRAVLASDPVQIGHELPFGKSTVSDEKAIGGLVKGEPEA
jgi:hypothetical protein